MLSVQQKYTTDVSELRRALRVNQSKPELIVLERSDIWILRIVDDFVAEGWNAEHDARVSQTAME